MAAGRRVVRRHHDVERVERAVAELRLQFCAISAQLLARRPSRPVAQVRALSGLQRQRRRRASQHRSDGVPFNEDQEVYLQGA